MPALQPASRAGHAPAALVDARVQPGGARRVRIRVPRGNALQESRTSRVTLELRRLSVHCGTSCTIGIAVRDAMGRERRADSKGAATSGAGMGRPPTPQDWRGVERRGGGGRRPLPRRGSTARVRGAVLGERTAGPAHRNRAHRDDGHEDGDGKGDAGAEPGDHGRRLGPCGPRARPRPSASRCTAHLDPRRSRRHMRPVSFAVPGDAYDRFVGRYPRRLATGVAEGEEIVHPSGGNCGQLQASGIRGKRRTASHFEARFQARA
jgi:hypothetical protein